MCRQQYGPERHRQFLRDASQLRDETGRDGRPVLGQSGYGTVGPPGDGGEAAAVEHATPERAAGFLR